VAATRTSARATQTKAGELGRQAGHFMKHVVPAAVKPVHSLWHEVLGFFFLAFAGLAAFKLVRNWDSLEIGKKALIVPFVVILAAYGISSFRKARKISRS